jgi:hypothetical protein
MQGAGMRWSYLIWLSLLPTSVVAATGGPLDAAEAKAICGDIVQGMRTQSLAKHQVHFSQASPALEKELATMGWNDSGSYLSTGNGTYATVTIQGKRDIFESMQNTGTCSTDDIVQVHPLDKGVTTDAAAADEHSPGEADDDDLRWATWGASSSLYVIRGRFVVLEGTTAVYAFSDGKRLPLCVLKAPSSKTVIRHGEGAMCMAAKEHSIPKASSVDFTPDKGATDAWGFSSDSARIATVGQRDNADHFGHFHFDSSAGCGGSFEYLTQVDATGHILDTPLTRALLGVKDQKSANEGGIESYTNESVFDFHGQSVIAQTEGPITKLYHIKNGGLQQDCELEDIPQPEVSRYFPL